MTPEQINDRSARARRLEYAINRMAARYASAVGESAMSTPGGAAEIKATRARFRRHAALMRLTKALADLAAAPVTDPPQVPPARR